MRSKRKEIPWTLNVIWNADNKKMQFMLKSTDYIECIGNGVRVSKFALMILNSNLSILSCNPLGISPYRRDPYVAG